jgi:hypothetical protein
MDTLFESSSQVKNWLEGLEAESCELRMVLMRRVVVRKEVASTFGCAAVAPGKSRSTANDN